MLDLVGGLPLHPLVVHAVVVLLPLAALGTVAIALVRRWRRTLGPFVVASAAVATALVPVATSSGEALARRVGGPGEHAELGEQLIWFAVPLLVLSAAIVVLGRRRECAEPGAGADRTSRVLLRGLAVLAVVASLATGYQVYRVGDTGARAVWGEVSTSSGSTAGP